MKPSPDGLFHRLRGLATARCGHDGPGAKPDRAARWASGGLRPAVLSSPPRPELQYHRRTDPRGRGVDPDRRRPTVSDESTRWSAVTPGPRNGDCLHAPTANVTGRGIRPNATGLPRSSPTS